MDELDELRPGWNDAITLQAIVPLLCGAIHIEQGQPNLALLWRLFCAGELLAPIQPRRWVVLAVVFGEHKLVDVLHRKGDCIARAGVRLLVGIFSLGAR